MRKNPIASYSFCRRSAGSHGSTTGSINGSLVAATGKQFVLAEGGVVVRALRRRQHDIDRGIGAGTVRLQRVERARGGEAFQHALVDAARIDAAGKIGEVGEGTFRARLNDALDSLAADAAQRRQRVVDGVALDLEFDARAIDRRRLDLDAEPFGLGAKFGELVGVADLERHRSGEKLDRIIRLHVGGLIGQ